MAHAINRYKADLREFQFVLFEQFKLQDILTKAPFADWGQEECLTVLSELYRFVCEVIGPSNAAGDAGCTFENGEVKVPPAFREVWKQLKDSGWKLLGVDQDLGGQGAPGGLRVLAEEMLSGANVAFSTYPGLAAGGAEVVHTFGTDKQKETYVTRLNDMTWGGTMCLTEPHAGSDVGMVSSSAKRNADGTYMIRGSKIFITAGDHDLVENIIHLVLARIEGAPAGTKGLSLFIVPKRRVNADGSCGELNDVAVAAIEHKMGINGSATCQLNFGENDACMGELVGGVENQGMGQMFKLMNSARIATGLQGLSIASSAYLNALEYAKDRKQGASIVQWKDPTAPRVPIIQHPDVRRMLLDMKARVEGVRALIIKLTTHMDFANALGGTDDDKRAYHIGQVDLLVPLVKAYGSDQAFRICET
ncbi:MAG: acyl-CoA dehydrogenase family protein, partial [Deltaproteobacteria bacterium]